MSETITPATPTLTPGSDTGISNTDDNTSDTTPTITGAARPGAVIALYDGVTKLGSATADAATGLYTITVSAPLDDGVHTLSVTATAPGATQSRSSAPLTVIVDTTAPSAPPAPNLTAGSDTGVSYTDDLTKDTTPTVAGTAEPGSTVTLLDNDGTVLATGTAGASGNYVLTSKQLAAGAHALTVTATDAAGNVSYPSAPLNIVIDTTPGTATTAPAEGQTQDPDTTAVRFSIHFDQPVSNVTLNSFRITRTGTVAATIESITGSGADYTLLLDGVAGTGTIGVTGTSVTDLAGNPVTVTSYETYSVDSTRSPDTYLVSSSATGAAGTGKLPSLSDTGGYVAFNSTTGSLVPSGAGDGTDNVFVKCVYNGAIILVSVGTDGDANGNSYAASLSGDAQEIAFESDATNLVPGGTPAGQSNIYVASLTTIGSGGTLSLVPGSIKLVSPGGATPDSGTLLSQDGSTVAFDSSAALVPGAETGVENVYVENISTGKISLVSGGTGEDEYAYEAATDPFGDVYEELTPEGDMTPGHGGDFDSGLTGISADGNLISYESLATDLGGAPIDPSANVPVSRGYVYNVTTGVTTVIDGTGLINATQGALDTVKIQTFDPVVSSDGSNVYFLVYTSFGPYQEVQYLYELDLATGEAVSVSQGVADRAEEYDFNPSVANGGGYVVYQSNPLGYYSDQTADDVKLVNTTLTGAGTWDLGQALDAVISPRANSYAVTVAPAEQDGTYSDEIYETFFNVSASIDPISGDDNVDANEAAQAIAGGLTVTGQTNAPAGSTVLVYAFFPISATASGTILPTVTGTADGNGHWSATLPPYYFKLGAGKYVLALQIQTPGGGSDQEYRVYTISTQLPATPPAPVVVPSPDAAAGLQNGTVYSNIDTPPVTGTSSVPYGTVALYDAADPSASIATGDADRDGNYALTLSNALTEGLHHLEVQITDVRGNVSAVSAPLSLVIDTTPPDDLAAPTVVGGVRTDIVDPVEGSSTASSITNYINSAIVMLTGTAEPNTLVDVVSLINDKVVGEGMASAAGTYTIATHPLADGQYNLCAVAKDDADNFSSYTSYIVLDVDTQAPAAPVLTSVTGQTASDGSLSSVVDISGTAEPNSQVSLLVDGVADTTDPAVATDTNGDFSLRTLGLPSGTHTLTVTATDAAGNVSTASSPDTVTISATPVPPPGTPPDTTPSNGTVTDGPIAGATVFADANGNGVQDPGEASVVTSATGTFALFDPSGELIATGGIDSETGLTPPGELTAPAGATVIDPLTTLLDAYAATVGETPQAAQPALLASLGLAPGADLTQTVPETAAAGGDFSFLIADAKVMDAAVVYGDLAAALTGVSSATGFAAAFDAMAQQAATGTLNLDDGAATLVTLAGQTVAIAKPGTVLSSDLAQDAAAILSSGAHFLDLAAAPGDGSTPVAFVTAVESVDQGQAAPQFAAASNEAGVPDTVSSSYSNPGGLYDAVEAAEMPILAAPLLDPADDTGLSADDNLTSLTTVTFTGKAPLGATVFLVSANPNAPGSAVIVGSGTADTGGLYAIAAGLKSGRNEVVALQAAPGETIVDGAGVSVPTTLVGTEVTEVTVGDLPAYSSIPVPPPTIDKVQYTASSANTATATSLYVTGEGSYDIQEGAVYTVTANGIPVSVGAAQGQDTDFGILTTPLAAGTYSLVVTETALDGETAQSAPTTVTVTAPGSLSIQAEAGGPVVGGSIVAYDEGYPELAISPDTVHPDATTDGSGAASLPAQDMLPAQGSTLLYPTDEEGLELNGGQDALTGLILPVNLSAPPGSSVITPATSLLTQADVDAATGGLGATGVYAVTAADYAYENSRIDTALGLPTTVELSTSDPLTMAEAGDPALFLKDVELLDTTFLLMPFTVDGDAATYTADPLYVIDKSLFVLRFDDFGDSPPAITTTPIDFTSAAQVLAWLTTYDTSPIFGSYDTFYDASVLPTVAAIIAASNAAIETHAAASTSLADTISYALAVERVALSGEEQALAAQSSNYTHSVAKQQAGFATLQADYTGPGLQAAVAAALAQAVQVTSFGAASASTGAAQDTFTITFSAPVGGITAGDFTVSDSAGLVGAAVTAVTPVAGSDGAAYSITVGTGVGDGTLTLRFTPNVLANPDGAPLASGTFAAPQSYSSPSGHDDPQSVATGDFNDDGHTDVVIANDSSDGLTLFLGQGDGSFIAEPAIYTGSGIEGALQVVTGDFNGDDKLDAVTLNSAYSYDETVSAMLGNGDGTFAPPVQTDVGQSAVAMVAGDFNGDGKLDLAVLDSPRYGGDGSVQLFYGNGDGTFSAGATMDVGAPLDGAQLGLPESGADHIVAADLNGDGKLDLVISTSSATTGAPSVTILLGNGKGGFTLAAQPVLGLGVDSGLLVAVGDVNGDGIPDIVAVPGLVTGSETAAVLLGNGDGTFQPGISVPLGLPGGSGASFNENNQNVAVAIGDVADDGKPDIVVENIESGVVVVPGNGDGTFGQAYSDATAGNGSSVSELALADVNGDGLLDLISTNDSGSEAGTSVGPGISVSLGTAQTVLPASASVTVDRAAVAQPTITETSGGGSFTQVGNAYTLDLGTLAFGAATTAVFALANAAAAPADSFDGTFSAPTGDGFTLTGASLAEAIAAGQSQGGITFTADTSTSGSHSETITFAPRDTTATPAQTTVSVDDSGPLVLPSVPDPDAVALELPALTLTITDDVTPGAAVAEAMLGAIPSSLVLPNVRVGSLDTQALPITNSAAPPAAALDLAATAGGDATVAGAITDLAAGATDATSLTAGLGTAAAGAQTGSVTLDASSDAGNGTIQPLSDSPTIDISGSVFRLAAASIVPVSEIVHVGDPGTVALSVANSDPADGYSESLLAALGNVSGQIGVAAAGPTGEIAAGSSSDALAVSFSTTQVGTLTGTAEVLLTSDGGTGAGSIDGLGQAALGTVAVPVTVTVDNYAIAELTSSGGQFTAGATANSYVLNLGTLAQGATPVAVSLAALNAALGPADDLDGSYTISNSTGFTNTGFAAFSDLGAGSSAGGDTVALNTSNAGNFSETITLDPTDGNSAGYSEALPDKTVTVVGSVLAPSTASATGSATGDVHIVSFDGLHYGFQALGDFTLSQSTRAGDSFRVQIHTAVYPYIAGTTVITEAAAQVGSDIVTFGIGQAGVTIYGVPAASLTATHPTQLLDGGTITLLAPDTYQLRWTTGESMTVTNMGQYLNLSVSLGSQDGPGSVQGLLGRFTGLANDISLPDGTVLQQPVPTAELLGAFATAWMVAPGQSLLEGNAGLQSTTIPGTVVWPATAGSAGQSVASTADTAGAATNSADAQGESGGAGGNGDNSPTDPATGDYIAAGGDAAAGGGGGGAAATAATSLAEPTISASATATATGGTGGSAGMAGRGTTTGRGAAGGNGGVSTATASASDTDGAASASAISVGGNGGSASSAGGGGGDGGTAGGATATAYGTTSASASVTQTGGNGGNGSTGANGGNGASSNLSNAASGTTDDGTLTLFQKAIAGNGGNSDTNFGGAAGSATSSLTFDDTQSQTRSAAVDVTVQAQGGNAGAGGLYHPDGGTAAAYADIIGAHDVTVTGVATGGTSPEGLGGAASASVTATGDDAATASATSTGGAGASSTSGHSWSGGASTGATATASGAEAAATATGTGGESGGATGAGNAGGAGATATGTSAVAKGITSATASATQTGGTGGAGTGGASGGSGAGSSLINAVSGTTDDGTLTLTQIADGGAGGGSDTGTGGAGGNASSSLTLDDTGNVDPSASITADVTGAGGAGGASAGVGGNGGSTWDGATVTGAGNVTVTTTAEGGSAGINGAQGGDASAAAAATGIDVRSKAIADGGAGEAAAGTATANAKGVGTSGTVEAVSSTALGAGPVASVPGDAAAAVDGTATAGAQASFGGAVPSFGTGAGAEATIKAMPTGASVVSALATDPTTQAAMGATPAYYAVGELGGGHSASGSDSQTSTASADIKLDLLQLGSTPDLFLAFSRPTTAGAGISGISLTVTADGTSLLSESFASAAAAKIWFSDHPIDLGPLSSGVLAASPTLDLHVALSVTSSHVGSSFETQFLVGGAPANAQYALL